MGATSHEILLIGSEDPTTWIAVNHLRKTFGDVSVVLEKRIPRKVLLRNRIKKLGLATALSQAAFVGLVRPLLKIMGSQRIAEIARQMHVEMTPLPASAFTQVENINDPDSQAIIASIAPKVIVVNGTRILKRSTLACVAVPFINIHQGTTPRYRGAHGAYWALYNNDRTACGVTVHLVDPGIDTGNIVSQAQIHPGKQDSFVTYPILQAATAMPLLEAAVRDALAGNLKSHPASGPSAVWYHPGIFQYCQGLLRGIR